MKICAFLLVLVLNSLSFKAGSQIRTISVSQLQKRISNTDTVYVVNFWATWCGSCVKELPNFDRLQRDYKGQPLVVMLISMDSPSRLESAVIPFVNNHQLTTGYYIASRKNDQELINDIDKDWSGALPATLVVNTKKKIRKFYEKDFTYDELNKIYQSNK
jgi:thiol-disulfide isomerase/thioredoxin